MDENIYYGAHGPPRGEDLLLNVLLFFLTIDMIILTVMLIYAALIVVA